MPKPVDSTTDLRLAIQDDTTMVRTVPVRRRPGASQLLRDPDPPSTDPAATVPGTDQDSMPSSDSVQ